MTPAAEYLQQLVREAFRRTTEETAVRMMEAHRRGRTICLLMTEAPDQANTVAWRILATTDLQAPAEEA
jgi:ATP-dependent Clp protease adapter protein ClpS